MTNYEMFAARGVKGLKELHARREKRAEHTSSSIPDIVEWLCHKADSALLFEIDDYVKCTDQDGIPREGLVLSITTVVPGNSVFDMLRISTKDGQKEVRADTCQAVAFPKEIVDVIRRQMTEICPHNVECWNKIQK